MADRNQNTMDVDIERAKQVDIVALIGRSVKWQRIYGQQYWACCPFHNEKSASFKVENARHAFKCFGCGEGGDAIAWMIKARGLSFRDAVRELIGEKQASLAQAIEIAPAFAQKSDHGISSSHAWKKTWSRSQALRGTVGEKYLLHRVGRDLDWPVDLRFHRECWRNFDGNPEKHPAIVALVRNIRTNKPQAVHRTFLNADGSDRLRDRDAKKFQGPSLGGAVKLTADEDVNYGLGLAEGLEKGLSLVAAGWSPIWVTCGTSGLATFPVLNGIESLSVFADHGTGGQAAARTCAQRWADACTEDNFKETRIVTPKITGTDWSDALQGVGT